MIGLMSQNTNPDGGIANVHEEKRSGSREDQSFDDDMNGFIDENFEF